MFLKPVKTSEIASSHLLISHLRDLEPRICQLWMQVLLALLAHGTADQNVPCVLAQGRCAGFQSWHCRLKDGDGGFRCDGGGSASLNTVQATFLQGLHPCRDQQLTMLDSGKEYPVPAHALQSCSSDQARGSCQTVKPSTLTEQC